MAEVNLLTQLYNDFITVLQQTVIKYNILADKNETLDMKKAADAYINAYLMKDKFQTYVKYDEDVIADVMQLNMTTQYPIIAGYRDDNRTIPYKKRDLMLKKQRAKIVNNYVEKNNYYRMLNGKPDYEEPESEYFYVDEETAMKYNIDPEIPVHELDEVKISLLQTLGWMDKLIQKHPDKPYLKFLGKRQIDIITARTAKNFAVLRIPYDVTDAMWDRFAQTYEQCREYFMACIYITEFRNTIDYYDNFIAMCIMVMTIQQVIARVIKDTIERNFFDDYCVRTLFSVYGVPYYSYMSFDIKRQIVQDLNILVLNKGTNRVLYDIATILGYDRLKIYKYYLMKVQKFDANNFPVVYYKDEPDPATGEKILDYEKMFDVYFQKVEIQDLDTYKSLLDPTNKCSYEEITSGDPFWVEDEDLFNEIYESEYNFVETKYLGVSISYRLSKILFENVYLLKMILEKKDEIPGILLYLPKISSFSEVNLFDTIVALCAMVCKQNHLKGEILTRQSAIMHVLGFNFQEDFEKIKQDILSNPYLDNSLTEFFKDSSTYTVAGINRLYNNILELYDVIVERMSTTQDIEVYDAYRKFYESLYYTDENRSMFVINVDGDGVVTYASTFMEYLQYMNPDLYELIDQTSEDDLSNYINHICQKIMAIIPNLKYLGVMAGRSEIMEKMLVELITFFKSYTTDMIGLNIVYIFDMKPELLLRLIDDVIIHKTIEPHEEFLLSYSDHLTFTSTVRYKSWLHLWDKIKNIIAFIDLFDTFKLNDEIVYIHKKLDMEDGIARFYDVVEKIMTQTQINERLILSDIIKNYIATLYLDDKLRFKDYLAYIFVRMKYLTDFTMYDTVDSIKVKEALTDNKIAFSDVCHIYNTFCVKDKLSFREFVEMITATVAMHEDFTIYDAADVIAKLYAYDTSMNIHDSVRWQTTNYQNDAIAFTDKVASVSTSMVLKNHSNMFFDIMEYLTHVDMEDKFGFRDTCKITYSE